VLLLIVYAAALQPAPTDAQARIKPVRADLDGDRRTESVRVVLLRHSPRLVRLLLRDGARRRHVSGRLSRVSALRAIDATRDGRPEVWFVGRAGRRVIAGLVRWNARHVRRLFAYDARRSSLGRRWRNARLRFVDMPGGSRALELELVETARGGARRTAYLRYVRGRYRRYRPPAGAVPVGGETPDPGDAQRGLPAGLQAPPEPRLGPPAAFLAPGGNDGGACRASAPCGSLDRALQVVGPGQLVQVAGGTYPEQILQPTPSRPPGSAPVAVRPAAGADVRMGELHCGHYLGEFGPDAVDIGDMTINGAVIQRCDRVTLRRVTLTAGIFVNGSTNFSMVGGSVGPGVDFHPDVQAVNNVEPPIVPRNVLFEGVLFHDWTLATVGIHTECLQVSDVRNFTMRRSRFQNCDTFDLHIQGTVAGPVEDIVVENNVFEPSEDHTGGSVPSYYSLSVRSGHRVLIRNNASTQTFALPAHDEPISDWSLIGNVTEMHDWACDDRIAYRHNLWSDTVCGATDRRGPLGFVNGPAGDYRPAPGSLAIDASDPVSYPPTDILGRARPRGGGPDIGAYEER